MIEAAAAAAAVCRSALSHLPRRSEFAEAVGRPVSNAVSCHALVVPPHAETIVKPAARGADPHNENARFATDRHRDLVRSSRVNRGDPAVIA